MRHLRKLLFCSLLIGPVFLFIIVSAATNEHPNIIFILADDLGWTDLGCYGSTFYDTPNLDKLAASGMRFTDAYAACCVCSPTRASILTGKYPARLHITDWLPGRPDRPDQKFKRPEILDHLPLEEVTVAEALKAGGYTNAFIGKWHLGDSGFSPDKQGFDINIAGCKLGQPPSYFSPYKIPTLKEGPKGEYLTDRLTDEAIHFIQSAKDKPFFLYLAHYAVHTPHQAKADLIKKYEEKAKKLPPLTSPAYINERAARVRQIQNLPVYAAMMESLDESVGRIMRTISELGLDKNTIIIFTSDNGGYSTSQGSATSNLPLRAGKGWPYEGGTRVPLIVCWPGVAKKKSVCDQPMCSPDFYPTLLQMADLPIRPEQHVDGTTFVPLLKGHLRSMRPIFWHYPHYSPQLGSPYGAIRFGVYKMIEWYEDMHVELYDLAKDPGERHDLAGEMAPTITNFREQLHQWRADVHADMPVANPDYKPGKQAGK